MLSAVLRFVNELCSCPQRNSCGSGNPTRNRDSYQCSGSDNPKITGLFPLLLLTFWLAPLSSAIALERIELAPSGDGFRYADSKRPFQPWGFNYDHDRDGKLLEQYWEQDWEAVAGDFREMRALGANVVRIHLQFGAMMESAEKPREASLKQLEKLLELAEQEQLYLDLTGLGCYDKTLIPDWYDTLDEAARWEAQAAFWTAIAGACRNSPAVFCYDIMNEPVVPGGDQPQTNWLGPGFGYKYFVQFITRDRANRNRPHIARAWIQRLAAAIRKVDERRLITVGLVPWSLDRPGLTSGFVPEQIATEVDFLSVHLYPKQDELEASLDVLRGFAVTGKPVVIEEIFPLGCSMEQLGEFIEKSSPHAEGWIGFYWGKTRDEYRSEPGSLGDALTLQWLDWFAANSPPGRQHLKTVAPP